LALVVCLFSSSRRRHTRFSRDWSSDVCSSDLVGTGGGGGIIEFDPNAERRPDQPGVQAAEATAGTTVPDDGLLRARDELQKVLRSEERRVGEESRGRWRAHG